MKIEIISNINMDSLKFYLKEYEFLDNCNFGNYLIDLMDKNSSLYKSDSSIVILFLDADELDFNELDNILEAVENFINKTGKILIVNTLSFYPYYIDTFLHNTIEKELKANLKILKLKDNPNILVFDFNKLSKRENIFDEKYWYLGRIKFSKRGFELISREIDLLIKTHKFGSKKVLILDLDNTLWGGIIGEEEIRLANDGIGKIYVDFQKNIKRLKDFGILLAICSKNNYKDGIAGLEHPNSILKEDDFIVKKINWNDKATNIKEIMEELNLGFDSAVFIDDNPVERELIKTMLPSINVVDFPKDINRLNKWFIEDIVERYFSKIAITKEDAKKDEQYKAKIKRDILLKDLSYEEFLENLDIELNFLIDDDRFIERYAQMTQKTNQFNLTTKRYATSDIKKFIKDEKYTLIAVDYKDKFANEGITGLVILEDKDDYIEIDTFLLSCRILKRGVESLIFEKIDNLFEKDIVGIYIPTKKNTQVADLYLKHGFKKIDNTFIRRRDEYKK